MDLHQDNGPLAKALQINLDDSIYGTFAEIGAGQEVARNFFQAGRASNTIAKSISAYDMTFSDEIYGKESRYVCLPRLMKMLDHEYALLEERLRQKRGNTTRFFAFADTVSTATQDGKSHGWMGVRYQTEPNGPPNDIIMHVKLWDRFRLPQQEALGILGVNLLHMAFFPEVTADLRIAQLIDSISTKRVEVNYISFSGRDVQHVDNRLMSLELVKQSLTEAVVFGPSSEVIHIADELYRQPVLVQRGNYRPITKANLEVLERVRDQFSSHPLLNNAGPKVLLEMTMASLTGEMGFINEEDFLHRVDTLSTLGYDVMVSNFRLFHKMKSFLRQHTDQAIGLVVGAHLLPKIFDESFYADLPGGILEGMSRLFDDRTKMFVFPNKGKGSCISTGSFVPPENLKHLYKHLTANEWLVDASDCAGIDTSVQSSDIRGLLEKGDPKWKSLVPEKARKVIEERQLFGFRP